MNAERLLAHYEKIADAPDAIARLRRFILDLAVRGKLVPQDAKDEPASELLKRIAKEKARLVKAGEIRKPKSLPEIEAPPFDLPHSWRWTPIREVTSDRGQEVPQSTFTYIDVTAIDKEAGIVADPKVLEASEAPSRARKITRKDDVIYSCVRPYLLNVAVIEADLEPAPIASTAFAILNGHGLVLPRYIWIVLRSPFMVACVEENQRGQAYPAINDADFAVLPFPLPPLAEQHRIVAKVDELMALCDRLEAARQQREATRDKLTAASLARLNAPDAETFREDARFALDALPALTARADQIKQLRQTILNLAVRGKLAPQDATDGTGDDLVRQLGKLRNEVRSAGRGRREASNGEISSEEKYLEIPTSWAWARVHQVGTTQTGTSPSSANPAFFGDHIPFVKPADLDGRAINYDGPGLSEEGMHHSRVAQASTVLMVCIGATLGKVNITERSVCFNQQINAVTPYMDGLHRFISISLRASGFQALAWSKAGTGTLPIISKGKWEVLPIPLPPLAEQHRIVAKVDALMALCDRLEASLATADDTRRRLLDAFLAEALAPADARDLEAAE